MLELEEICKSNLYQYKKYENAYETDLKEYQSRIYPSETAEKLCWYHIKYDNNYIGAVWLEKEAENDFAVLGIFIADKAYRNKGIGAKAIQQILKNDLPIIGTDKVILHVRESNKRAIACYKKIGFSQTKRYMKNNISVIEMAKFSDVCPLPSFDEGVE